MLLIWELAAPSSDAEKCTESSHELALSSKTVLSGPIKGTNFQTRQVTTWVTYTPKTVFSDPIRARKQDQPSQDFSDQVSLRSLAYSLVESKLSPPIRPWQTSQAPATVPGAKLNSTNRLIRIATRAVTPVPDELDPLPEYKPHTSTLYP